MIDRSRAICFASCPMMRMVYILFGTRSLMMYSRKNHGP
nr:MAG TPA: hypothetical protein [Caudoviricetes sp.]